MTQAITRALEERLQKLRAQARGSREGIADRREKGVRLLFKGNDFTTTDLSAAEF